MPNSPKAALFFYRRNLESLLYECSYDLMQQKFYNSRRFHKMCDLISMLLSPKNIALCYISSAYITYCYFVVKPMNGSLSHTTEKVRKCCRKRPLRSPTSATILMVRHCPWGKGQGISPRKIVLKSKQWDMQAETTMLYCTEINAR